jgi:D-alanine-D-alanine ligase
MPLRIALVYDTFDAFQWTDDAPPDADAEFEPEETVEALCEAVRALGHEPVRIGTAHELLQSLPTLDCDAGLSIAEGSGSRNREGYAPTLFEMAGVPFVGSDALTLSLSLDKAWTHTVVAAQGVRVPPWRSVGSARELERVDPADLPAFPLFVKPRGEGSAMGIGPESKVHTWDELRREVERITTRYRQPALVERFVEGAEFTVGVTHDGARVLPALQRATDRATGIGLHALEARGSRYGRDLPERPYELASLLTPELEAPLAEQTLAAFHALGCRDFARMDFRVDAQGAVYFLEANPLPTFAPDGTFAIVAELLGQSYARFLSDVLGHALERVVSARPLGPPDRRL